jgi:hypothetical protein
MMKSLDGSRLLPNKTLLLVDVSGSMNYPLSAKSEMTRLDAAYGLAILLRELCEKIDIYSFSNECILIPSRRGMALRDAIDSSQSHSHTYLGSALLFVKDTYDRIVVITDEQSQDSVPNPTATGYMINVASNKHGVGYGKWIHLDGFSEVVVDWIQAFEDLK